MSPVPPLPPGGWSVTCASTLEHKMVVQIFYGRVQLVVKLIGCLLDSFFWVVPSVWLFGKVWMKSLTLALKSDLYQADHSASEC